METPLKYDSAEIKKAIEHEQENLVNCGYIVSSWTSVNDPKSNIYDLAFTQYTKEIGTVTIEVCFTYYRKNYLSTSYDMIVNSKEVKLNKLAASNLADVESLLETLKTFY